MIGQKSITGTVTEASSGEALIGVTVLIKGDQARGTITDFNGEFEIVASEGETLVFSYAGMEEQEVEVGPTDVLNVQMSSNILLDEVVITGYGEQLRSSFTGSVSKPKIEDIQQAPRTNFQESLTGNVSGLQVNQGSGQPGAFQNVRIRGLGSINAGTNPLYVIDGIPVINGNIGNESTTSTPMSGINPNDIESINVLKDASATSLYGSRGANGVIIITTKKGKSGKPKFNFGVQTGVSNVSLADKLRPLNSAEYVELMKEGLINRGFAENDAEALTYLTDRGIDPAVDTDWFDAITQQGSFRNTNLSVSGGNDATRYFVSGGYQQNEGVVIGTGFTRASARVNLTTKFADWITVDFNNSASYTSQNTALDAGAFANPVRSIFRFIPTEPVYNEDGSYNLGINSGFHPVGEMLENKRLSNILNLNSSVTGKIDLMKGLSYRPTVSINRIEGADETYFIPDFGTGNSRNGYAEADFDNNTNWMVRNLITYNNYFNDAHGLDITLGHEAQKFSSYFVQTLIGNLPFPQLNTLSNGANPESISGSKTANTIESFFLNTSYNYQGLVYLNGTIRRDGSSRFGSDVRYGTFWSGGASVNLHRLSFLNGNNAISALRLRASYGENGNESISNFASLGLYSTGADYNGNPGIFLSQLANPGLTWEVNRQLDVAVELGLWNRVDLVVDFYNRRTSSLIFDLPVSLTNGVSSVTSNIGSLQNQGVEIELETQNIENNNNGFNWSTSFNITFNKNKVISLPEGDFADGSRYREVGKPWSTWYFQGYAGVDTETGEAMWYTDETESETTTSYNAAEPYQQGTSDPDFYGGLTNVFSYKGINLSAQFVYNYGGKILHSWHSFTHTDGSRSLSTTGNLARSIYERRWQNPGDVTDTPQFIFGRNTGSRNRSTRFLYDGTYISLRDISLSYSLPKALTQRASIDDTQLFVRGSNMWIWTKDERLERDPRTDAGGSIDQEIPIPTTFTFGLNVSF
ncbi:SusC/RagA family TonB-linked outer membrane protein [Portibacter lacus]|uniref:SusC/RagA family TonB-linked outer membrane protein n=2 Tax=Portibacter lacus TaxID=1099794 RepID=A0AA37SM64_9BACT|nr:SusC/RagA family TonB-linked outer membrane protein [Portibacter lacus]